MDGVRVLCTSCGKRGNVPLEYLGRRIQCPECGTPVLVAERGDVEQTAGSADFHKRSYDEESNAKIARDIPGANLPVFSLLEVDPNPNAVIMPEPGPYRLKETPEQILSMSPEERAEIGHLVIANRLRLTTSQVEAMNQGTAATARTSAILWSIFTIGLLLFIFLIFIPLITNSFP